MRYQGESKSLVFEKNQESLTLNPQYEGEMQVIPLSGTRHFWSADFLLAFSLNKKLYPYRWTID